MPLTGKLATVESMLGNIVFGYDVYVSTYQVAAADSATFTSAAADNAKHAVAATSSATFTGNAARGKSGVAADSATFTGADSSHIEDALSATSSATFTGLASSSLLLAASYIVSASDSATFTDEAALALGGQNQLCWLSPSQMLSAANYSSTGTRLSTGYFSGHAVTTWGQHATALFGTVYYEGVLSQEFKGESLVVRVYWVGSPNSGVTGVTLNAGISGLSAGETLGEVTTAWAGSLAVTLPVESNTIQYTDITITAPPPAEVVAGAAIMVSLGITLTLSGTFAASIPVMVLGISVRNR